MRILVIGTVNLDVTARSFEKINMNDSNPGSVKTSFGGVGFNIARNLHGLGLKPEFISGFSDDIYGKSEWDYCRKLGLNTENSQIIENSVSGQYVSIEDENGEMVTAVCEAGILDRIDIDKIVSLLGELDEDDIAVIDSNYSKQQLERLIPASKARIFVDPISVAKAQRVRDVLGNITLLKPNRHEAEILTGIKCDDEKGQIENIRVMLERGTRAVALTLGSEGVIASDGKSCWKLSCREDNVVSVSGAGDSFISGMVYGLAKGHDFAESLKLAQALSMITLECETTVDETLSEEKLLAKRREIEERLRIREIGL